jgi:hypothetical protein
VESWRAAGAAAGGFCVHAGRSPSGVGTWVPGGWRPRTVVRYRPGDARGNVAPTSPVAAGRSSRARSARARKDIRECYRSHALRQPAELRRSPCGDHEPRRSPRTPHPTAATLVTIADCRSQTWVPPAGRTTRPIAIGSDGQRWPRNPSARS